MNHQHLLWVGLLAAALACGGRRPAALSPALMFRNDPAHTGATDEQLFAGQGGIRWQRQLGGAVRSTPVVTSTRVFVGSGDGFLYALERASGEIAWRFDARAPVHASPALADGLVIAATLSGRIFAVDAETGRLQWSVESAPPLPVALEVSAWDTFVSSPVVAGSRVIIGSHDGGVYALDVRSGRRLWRAQTGGRVRATPAIAGDVVVVGSYDARLYAFDLATGVTRWMHRTVGDTLDVERFGYDRRSIQGSAAIAGGLVYFGSRDGGVYALDLATGARRWRVSHGSSWVVASPAVHGGRLFVGSSDGGVLQALDAESGTELWRRRLQANLVSSPQLAQGALIVGTREYAPRGHVIVLDPESGEDRWRLQLDEAVLSSPVVYGQEIYVGTEGGTLAAIHEASARAAHLAVFFDSALAHQSPPAGAQLSRDYFAHWGYRVLDSEALASFFASRIEDGAPSVVVFALDILPRSVAPVNADTVLMRRYLDAGGKIVWVGRPVGTYVRDSLGRLAGIDRAAMQQLIGVSFARGSFSEHPGHPTADGRAWGIDTFVRSSFGIPATEVTRALAIDETGATTAWVREFRADRPGMGFVQLYGFGSTVERLPLIRRVAEYGLLRASAQ